MIQTEIVQPGDPLLPDLHHEFYSLIGTTKAKVTIYGGEESYDKSATAKRGQA